MRTDTTPAAPAPFPEALAAAGLTESTPYPHCSRGKAGQLELGGAFADTRRRTWADALTYPYIQIDPDNATAALAFDLDELGAGAALTAYVRSFGAPAPNWIAEDRATGRAHAVYCLASPVPRDASAAAADYLRDVRDGLRWQLRGDARYRGPLTRNPLHPLWLRTSFGAPPYRLSDLSDWLGQQPRGDRLELERVAPPSPVARGGGYGGPPGLFGAALQWAGRLVNADADIERAYLELAARFGASPTGGDVRAAVRGIERYRAQWAAAGWHSRRFRERQSARGRRSGDVRRERVAERDARIRAAAAAGQPVRSIAELEGISRSQTYRVLARDGGGA